MANHDKRLNDLEKLWLKPAPATIDAATLDRAVAQAAAERGIPAEDLLREAEAETQRMAAAGVTTLHEMAELVAAEEGLDPVLVQAEAERFLAECRGEAP
ncbi:MAG: hypothetical protein M3Q03_21300 [Chloroflexota bacterium]|nr:hypothetical protein [Chloroflexota bacterium]